MVTRSVHCDSTRLRLLLEDRLSEEEQDALSGHLEECQACREALEGMAAETRWWSDAKELGSAEATGRDQAACGPATEAERLGPDLVTIPNGFLEPADDAEALGRIGPYEVSAVIGRGGNGLVLKALDPGLRRLVAIKVLAPELATSAAARRRFAREARAAAAVTHEHVVAIHSVDTAPNGLPYLVMTYVPGKSLQERLDRSGALDAREILRIGMQTAAGLAAAHAQGLVHRDIKPANILLENGMERVKITDFGLARAADDASLSQSGVVAGTPQYMAPEQARGEAVDHRADLFSLGSVMYTMATGRPPFRAESTLAVLRRVSDDAPRPIREINAEVPEWLADVVTRLHEKDPADRFQSATEVADLLSRCLAFLQNPTDRVPPYRRVPVAAPRGALRRWGLPIAASLAVVLGLGAAEATGVTHVLATVLRVKTAEGTLEINVEEPGVDVEIDGKRVVVTGAGPHAVSLVAGPHVLRATKDGVPIKVEPVEIQRGGHRVVTIALDPSDRLKSQREYLEGLTPAHANANATEALTPPRDAYELARARQQLELLKERDRRIQARLDELEQKGGRRTHMAPADVELPATSIGTVGATARVDPTGLVGFGGPVLVGDGTLPTGSARSAEEATLTSVLGRLSEPVASVDFAPATQTLAAAAGRTVRVWNLAAASSSPQVLEGHTGDVTSVALSPTEPLLAAGTVDGSVHCWNIATGREKGRIAGIGGVVYSVTFRADGLALAVAFEGGRVAIVETATGKITSELPRHDQPVRVVRYSPDGKSLAVGGGNDDLTRQGFIKLWDVETGKEKRPSPEATLNGPRYRVNALAFSPDGTTLAAGECPPGRMAGAKVYSWNVASFERLSSHYVRGGVRAVEYSPDGGRIAAVVETGDLYVYTIAGDGAQPVSYSFQKVHSGGAATGLAFGPNGGETVVTGGKDGTVKLWTLRSVTITPAFRQGLPLQEPLATFRDGMGERVWSAKFAPDGKTLAACFSVNVNDNSEVGEGGGGLALWDPVGGNLLTTVLAPHVIRSVAFSSDGNRLATAEFDRAVRLRDVSDGKVVKSFPVSGTGANAVAFSPGDRLLAAAGLDGVVYVWETETGRETARLKQHVGPVHTVAFSPDGESLASGGADGDVLIWSLASNKVRRSFEGHEAVVEQLAFSPDGRTVATASWDQTVRLWRVATGKEIRAYVGHSQPVLGVAFSEKGDQLISCAGTWGGGRGGEEAGEIIIWDATKLRSLTPPLSYPRRVLGVAFAANPNTFATAAWDGTVRLWSVDSLVNATRSGGSRTVVPPGRPAEPRAADPAK